MTETDAANDPAISTASVPVSPSRHRRQAAPDRRPTKLNALLALLRRADGATLADLMQATGWQAHSVRGVLSGTITKKLGHRLQRHTSNGVRVYRIES